MENNKRFYWIKLKTNFFSREDIDFLLSQKNGCEYVVLYQMLCLNTANNNGRLESKIGELLVPYNADKIVRDCKYFDIDTVNVAMSLYKKLGLIYEEETDGILKISNYDEMVGSEAGNSNAQRQKRFRERQKQLKLGVTNSNDVNNESNITINNEEYRDKSIENRDIDIRDKDSRDKNNKLSLSKDTTKINSKQIEEEFEKLWTYYPNKKGKDQAKNKYIFARKNGTTYEEVAQGLKNYLNYIKSENIEPKFIKHGSTWFNQKSWNDDYKVTSSCNKKIDSQMELLKGVYNGTIKIN